MYWSTGVKSDTFPSRVSALVIPQHFHMDSFDLRFFRSAFQRFYYFLISNVFSSSSVVFPAYIFASVWELALGISPVRDMPSIKSLTRVLSGFRRILIGEVVGPELAASQDYLGRYYRLIARRPALTFPRSLEPAS